MDSIRHRHLTGRVGGTRSTKGSVAAAISFAIAVLFGLLVGGCGGDAPAAGTSSACASQPVTLSPSGVVQAGSCSLDTGVNVDSTAFGTGPEVGSQVASYVAAAASGTLTNGGNLRVALFSRDADREVVVFAGEIPAVGKIDEYTRNEQVAQARSAIESVITAAFDPAKQSASMRQQLAVLAGTGSDVVRAIGNAARDVALNDGRPSAAVVVSDGFSNTTGLNLQQELGQEPVGLLAREVARLAKVGGMPRVGLIAVEGLGQVPPQYQAEQSSEMTDKLIAVYRKACSLLRPASCAIATN